MVSAGRLCIRGWSNESGEACKSGLAYDSEFALGAFYYQVDAACYGKIIFRAWKSKKESIGLSARKCDRGNTQGGILAILAILLRGVFYFWGGKGSVFY
jgi:hypothetical protein